jgi:hypothetical protein
MVGSLLDLYA